MEFFELRDRIKPNSRGEVSLAEVGRVAREMGFCTRIARIRAADLETCSVPLIWRQSRNDFAVLLGMGEDKGVVIIEPPRSWRRINKEQLAKHEWFDVAAISAHPLVVDDARVGEPSCAEESQTDDVKAKVYGNVIFENPVWYFGHVGLHAKRSRTFSFVNRGDGPASIVRVRSTCPCFKIAVQNSTLGAEERGEIKVDMDATGLQGPVHKSIFGFIVRGDGKKAREVFVLRVHGEASRRKECVLIPERIFLPEMLKGSAVRKVVSLRRLGYEPLYVERFVSASPLLDAKMVSGLEPDAREALVELEISVPRTMGSFEYEAVLETNHSEHRTARLRVQGSVVPDLEVYPPTVFLGMLHQETGFERTVEVRSRSGKPFALTSTRTNSNHLSVTAAPVDENRSVWQVRLTKTGPLPLGILKGKIVVETDESDSRRLEIPYAGIVVKESP